MDTRVILNVDQVNLYKMIDSIIKYIDKSNYKSISIFGLLNSSKQLLPLFNILIYLGKIVVMPSINTDGSLLFFEIKNERDLNNLFDGKKEHLKSINNQLIELHVVPLFHLLDIQKQTSGCEQLITQLKHLNGLKIGLCYEEHRTFYANLYNEINILFTETNQYKIKERP
ncbi:hypothetical protein [Haloplasma contractile]|uniref:Uncharacterized protein n=1 Tax=Haloplasma contractile SSD-17B TaxID=1033810 RepID=U2EEF5_9MOLU|nr:hypothetical protein [Haloplasma contractile]ERJ13363.1 hypothetical protein HLPCO_000014 [Haloplasma contractile SSD-17B]